MAFERIDAVQDTATTTGTGPWTMSNAGVPAQALRAFSAHTIGATFRYRAFAGAQWEIGTGTLTDATHIARTVRKSSNADALVNFTAAPTVMEVVDSADVAAFLTAADGVDVTTLTAASAIADADSVLVIQGGTLKLAAAAVMKAYYGTGTTTTAPGQVTGLTAGAATDTTQVLNWTASSTGTAPFTYKIERSAAGANSWTTVNASVSGTTYTVTGLTASSSYDYRVSAINSVNTGPVSATLTTSTTAAPASPPGQVVGLTAGATTSTTQALTWAALSGASAYKVERSPAGANTWATATGGGAVAGTSFTVPGLNPSTNYDYRVTGSNTAGPGTPSAIVTKSTTAAPVQTLTVDTPVAQTVGTQFNATGTWTVTQPSALDYRLSDDPAGQWTAAPAGAVVNANGTYSFPLTPSTTSAGRTLSVRDRTTLVAGTSGAYAVNAAPVYDTLTDLRMVTASGSPVVYTGDGTATNFNQAAGGLWSKYFPANTDGSLTFEIPSTSGTMRFCLTDAANNGTLTPYNYAIWNLTNLYGTAINYEQNSPNSSYTATPTTNASIKPANNDVVKLDLINRSGAANTATLVVSVARAATPTTFTEIFRLPNFPTIALYPRWTITGAASIDKLQSANLVAR